MTSTEGRRATKADLFRLKARPGEQTVREVLSDATTVARWAKSIKAAKYAPRRHRRVSGPAPIRVRGSRRASCSRAGPSDDSGDPEPPGVDPQARRQTAG